MKTFFKDIMKNSHNIYLGQEIDSYTNKKYYILYVILNKKIAINVNLAIEEPIDEDTFKITLYFKNETEPEEIIINRKNYNKEFTFVKKRLAKKSLNFIIRVSNNKNIVFSNTSKDLFNKFFFLDF